MAEAAKPLGDRGLREIIARGLVRSLYQPIVSFESGDVVAYEALSRGPVGTPLESPAALFAEAGRLDVVPELDWVCREAAIRGALEAGMHPPLKLFINTEPAGLRMPIPARMVPLFEQATRELNVVVEFTERALINDPAALIGASRPAHRAGWGVAIDDVGVETASIALMPFVEPDLIKLDLTMIQQKRRAADMATLAAVLFQAGWCGAHVLAEGIETVEHLDRARHIGATLGQGWMFGRPETLPRPLAQPTRELVTEVRAYAGGRSAFDVASEVRRPLRAGRAQLDIMCREIEEQALRLPDAPVVVANFQDVSRFRPRIQARFAQLALTSSLVAAIGTGMPIEPAPGVRGAGILGGSAMAEEWTLAIVSPLIAVAISARELRERNSQGERQFDFVMSYDRDLVVRIAAPIIEQISAIA